MTDATKKKISISKKGKPSKIKGIKKSSVSLEQKIKQINTVVPNGYPNVVDYLGNIHIIINLRQFCRNNNLSQSCMRSLLKCNISHYKGWRIANKHSIGIHFDEECEVYNRGNNISSSLRKVKYPLVLSPENKIYEVEHLTKFCKIHNLSKGNMSLLLRNKKQIYKGWKTYSPISEN